MLTLIENIIIFSLVISSTTMLLVSNPVQSLLSLVLTFALSSVLFMQLGAEFMSLLIFMVYIGAIAVLFLFVVMMLNIKIVELRSTYLKYLPIGIFIIFFLLVELFFCIHLQFSSNIKTSYFISPDYYNWLDILDMRGNIYLLGYIAYSTNSHLFLLLALILLLAMIGCIVLIANWQNPTQLSLQYDMNRYKLTKRGRFNIKKRKY